MARAPAGLPTGIRLSDHISLGVIARTFPLGEVRQVLAETGRASERERDLPAHVLEQHADRHEHGSGPPADGRGAAIITWLKADPGRPSLSCWRWNSASIAVPPTPGRRDSREGRPI